MTAGKVGAGVDGVGVIPAVDALIVGKVALVQLERKSGLAFPRIQVGEVGPRNKGVRVVCA